MFRRTRFIALALFLVPAAAIAEEKKDEKKPAPVYKACPKNKVWSEEQKGCICAPGFNWDTPTRSCISASAPPPAPAPAPAPAPTSESKCVPGKQWSDAHNACVMACPAGKVANAKGDACVVVPKEPAEKPPEKNEKPAPPAGNGPKAATPPKPSTSTPKSCPEGKEWKDAFGGCVPICPADHVLDFAGSACHPIKIVRRPR